MALAITLTVHKYALRRFFTQYTGIVNVGNDYDFSAPSAGRMCNQCALRVEIVNCKYLTNASTRLRAFLG